MGAVVPTFIKYWNLTPDSSILDVGCAKGFMMHDIKEAIKDIKIKDRYSDYAISNCIDSMKDYVHVADAKDLPFKDNSFDVVISINTIHNLDRKECGKAARNYIYQKHSFVTVDAYRSEVEKQRMYA